MAVTLIGAPVGMGAGRGGTESGPRALRAAGLREALARTGRSVIDQGDLRSDLLPHGRTTSSGLKALPEVAAWASAIRRAVSAVPIGHVPIVLGGDHSLALGSLPGLAARAARHGRPFFVLWIDAHPDCHTLETTVSGHLHGTPVAHALGRIDASSLLPAPSHPLRADHLRMAGIRDVDPAEALFLAQEGIAVDSAAMIRTGEPEAGLRPWLDHIRAVDGLLHVSLDADSLDPSEAPGVGTPVPGGLRSADVRAMLADVAAAGVLGSMDLAEVNPFLDRDHRTARVMVELAASAFGQAAMGTASRRAHP